MVDSTQPAIWNTTLGNFYIAFPNQIRNCLMHLFVQHK